MRKYLRRIARAAMEAAGMERINKKTINAQGVRSDKSLFAQNWRNFVDTVPGPKQKKHYRHA